MKTKGYAKAIRLNCIDILLQKKDKETFISEYMERNMKNHNLPFGIDYFNLLAETEQKANEAYNKYIKNVSK